MPSGGLLREKVPVDINKTIFNYDLILILGPVFPHEVVGYFLSQPDKFTDIPKGVLAHSTHVRGIGTVDNDIEKPRIEVVLASAIPPDMCGKINLGYLDPTTVGGNRR